MIRKMIKMDEVKHLKEILLRIEKQNNNDHRALKARLDKTNGNILDHEKRLLTAESYIKYAEKGVSNRKWTIGTIIQTVVMVIAIIALFTR